MVLANNIWAGNQKARYKLLHSQSLDELKFWAKEWEEILNKKMQYLQQTWTFIRQM